MLVFCLPRLSIPPGNSSLRGSKDVPPTTAPRSMTLWTAAPSPLGIPQHYLLTWLLSWPSPPPPRLRGNTVGSCHIPTNPGLASSPGSSRGLDKHCSLLFYVHFYKVPKPACLPEVFLGILAPDHLNPSPPTSPRRQPDSC